MTGPLNALGKLSHATECRRRSRWTESCHDGLRTVTVFKDEDGSKTKSPEVLGREPSWLAEHLQHIRRSRRWEDLDEPRKM